MSREISLPEFLDFYYDELKNSNLDISEHLETLKRYAEQSESIVEMGVRRMVSTFSFIKGVPKKLTCIDAVHPREYLEDNADLFDVTVEICNVLGIDFEFILGDTLKIEIEPCNLLFIDTLHTFDQLSIELKLHGSKSKKWIILHDIESAKDELIPAVMQFLLQNTEWFIKEIYRNNNGLMILERNK